MTVSPEKRRWTLRWWADNAASLYAFGASSLVGYALLKALVERFEELSGGTIWTVAIIAIGLCVAAWRSL